MSDGPGDRTSREGPNERTGTPVKTTDPHNVSTPPVAEVVPPMEPVAPLPGAANSSWPTVLGVLAIVFGSLWILAGVWAILAPVVLQGAIGEFTDQQLTWYSSSGAWRVGLLLVAILSVAAAALLLVGGINLTRRRPGAASQLILWSIAMIVLTCVSISLQYAMQDESMRRIAAQTKGVPGGRATMAISMSIGLFCGLLLNVAGPVFLLLWFRRRTIRNEIATWA